MNVLPFDKQAAIISALVEGVSIRATERLTGVHRDTIMRLGARVGEGCAMLHDQIMRDLNVARVELDEAWSYVGKKQAKIAPGDDPDLGDQYVFIAMAASAKAIISYRIGKRTAVTTKSFINDLRARVLGAPEISSDGFQPYPAAIDEAFGIDCSFGVIEKHYAADQAVEAKRHYSPAEVVKITKRRVVGRPSHISTSFIERQKNLSLRMGQKRFARLSNGFSKRLTNHIAAVGLYVTHYNLCRVHETLRVTPAMQLGLTDHIWTISELVEAALQDWHSVEAA